ncbi:unnamed protein product [Rotaria sp. Silwood2]|nr:unnamed protein product [Rotaria sp. Silwood2]CAF4395643.1 unnamed protein product [Rotaria sp. Silwood2]
MFQKRPVHFIQFCLSVKESPSNIKTAETCLRQTKSEVLDMNYQKEGVLVTDNKIYANYIALDQTIVCSINRHGKSHGGINGRFTEETIDVWTNSFGFHAVLTNILHDVCDIETDNNGIDYHVECIPTRQTIDEQDLTKIMNKLKQEKLFSPATNEFRTLMSDKLVHEDVINNISTCFDRGLEAMASYVKYRLIKKVVPIDEPLKAMYYLSK